MQFEKNISLQFFTIWNRPNKSFPAKISLSNKNINAIKEIIADEHAKNDFQKTIQALIDQYIKETNDQMDLLEQAIVTQEKLKQKNMKTVKRDLTLLKTIPKDDSDITDLENQMVSLKNSQRTLTDIFNSVQIDVNMTNENS